MSGALLTVEISAAVSAVTGAASGRIWEWASRMIAGVRDRLAADHRALYEAEWQLTSSCVSTHPCFEVRVTCAPNRSLGRAEMDPDMAIRFVHEAFPDVFAQQPAYSSSRSGVRFLPAAGPGNIWVWKSGRVDLDWYLPPVEPSAAPCLDAVELLRPLALLAAALSHPAYVQLFGRRFRRRRRRFDWFIVVSPSVCDAESGESRAWAQVTFPVDAPPRAGTNQTPFSPPEGFASRALRDWDPRREVSDALLLFFEDFLKVNGYHDVETAVTGTVAVFRSGETASQQTIPSGSIGGTRR